MFKLRTCCIYADGGKSCSSNEILKMELASHSYSDVIVKNLMFIGPCIILIVE